MLKILISSILVLSSFSIYSQESEKISNIRKLLDMTGSGKLGVQIVNNMINIFKTNYPKADSAFWTEFRNEVKADELVNMIVPIYDRNFTDEEIRQLIVFYNSPIGRKVIEKLPAISQESVQVGSAWGEELGKKVLARLQEKGYAKEL